MEQLHQHLLTQTDRIRHNARIVLGFDSTAGDYIDDKILDLNEVEIEEECLKIIALHQPVADDLRFLVTVIKSNYNFERMGDLLENIHELNLNPEQIQSDLGDSQGDFCAFFLAVEKSITDASLCLANRNSDLAREVWKVSKEIEKSSYDLIDRFRSRLLDRPATPALLDGLLSIRFAKRLANNSANVAKEVLYLITGEIVRHRRREILG